MEQFVKVTGIAAPLLRINIDTDQIIPGKEIMRGSREGYGPGLFGYWRYIEDRTPNPDFYPQSGAVEPCDDPARRPQFRLRLVARAGAEIAARLRLSRRHRAELRGIFFNNSFRNGLLPVELPIEQVRLIAGQMEESRGNAA